MGFFGRKKINEEDVKYIATARALLERCLDVQESEILSEGLGLSEEEFTDFHVNKRTLAFKTVMYTAVISMEIAKRNKFVEIFINEKETRENIKKAPKDVQKMLMEMRERDDRVYHSIFEQVTKYVESNQCDPIDVLCQGFSKIFVTLLDQEESDIYLNIAKKIFHKHHDMAMKFLQEI